MSLFTYQKENHNKYEDFEWDNTWLDHINDKEAKRILYIGDSISCGLRRIATELTGGKTRFDGFGTSKSLDNPFFKESIRLFARQQKKRDAILFNNGLHGWHLEDKTEYKNYLEEMIAFLQSEFCNTPLVLIETTYVSDSVNSERVKMRNSMMRKLAEKYGVSIIDFFELSKENQHFLIDGVHFTAAGYEILAKRLLDSLDGIVSKRKDK